MNDIRLENLLQDAATIGKPERTKWEYMTQRGPHVREEELNELGQEGWELVGGLFANQMMVFKRPIPA